MQYNNTKMQQDKYIFGKPKGSIQKFKTYFTAIYDDNKYKSFSFNENNKDEIYKLAFIWLLQTSKLNNELKNEIKFIDNETICVNVNNNKNFICDYGHIDYILKYYTTLRKKCKSNKEYIYCCKNNKLISFPKIIMNYQTSKYIDNNTLNLKTNNLKESIGRIENKNIEDAYIYFDMYEKNEKLPENKLILGKPNGTFFKRTNPEIWISRINYEIDNEKKIKELSSRCELDAKKLLCNISNKLNSTINKIIICENYIKVEIDSENNIYMITDKIFLNIIQKHFISIYESHGRKYCYILIDGEKVLFTKLLIGGDNTMYLNQNFLDNRLINLFEHKNTYHKNLNLDDDDLNYIGKTKSYNMRFSFYDNRREINFSEKDYGNDAKNTAMIFRKIVSFVHIFDTEIFINNINKYSGRTLEIIKDFFTETLNKFLENHKEQDIYDKKLFENSSKIYEYYTTIEDAKSQIISSKLNIIKNIMNNDDNQENYNILNSLNNTFYKLKENPIVHEKVEITQSESETESENEIKIETNDNIAYKFYKDIFDSNKNIADMFIAYNNLITTEIPDITTTVIHGENRIEHYYKQFCTLASNRNAKVLSEKSDYITAHTKLDIKCKTGHIFSTSYNNLKANKWCPMCSSHRFEALTKFYVEYLFGKKFNKIRPDWLDKLELDMYNEDLNLAVEYNGIQHYKYINFFHKTNDDFVKSQERDDRKIKLCKQKNVNLLVIPYCDVTEETLFEYILDLLVDNNIDFPNVENPTKANMLSLENPKNNEVLDLITKKRGKLIDGIYITGDSLFLIECKKGHQWTTKARNLLNKDSWCVKCGYDNTQESNEKKSETLKKLFASEEGKQIKQKAHEKRSVTMAKQKEEARENITEKKCNGECGLVKNLTEFCKKAAAKDGYQSWCKSCTNKLKQEIKKNL